MKQKFYIYRNLNEPLVNVVYCEKRYDNIMLQDFNYEYLGITEIDIQIEPELNRTYPYYGENRVQPNLIVYFTKPLTGKVISDNDSYTIGYESSEWKEHNFTIINVK